MGKHRTAQRVRISNVLVVNTHLHWAVDALGVSNRSDAKVRHTQMQDVLNWLTDSRSLPTILVGDLNVYFAYEKIHSLLEAAGFESAYRKIHGFDTLTVPTPLEAPSIPIDSSV